FAGAVDRFADAVSTIAQGLGFLNESPKLSDGNRHDLEILMSRQALKAEDDLGTLKSSLALLADMLFKHYGRQVAVLIDEYDVPLAKAQQKGFHKQMITFYGGFLSFLKFRNWEQGNPIFKIVMTGCLRVAKNQIFTGANNFTPYTVVSDNPLFPALFGFTRSETEDYLSAFGLSGYLELVREHYDGYRILDEELFCPWDVSNFISDASLLAEHGLGDRIRAKNYWSGSESTNTTAIKDYVGTLSRDDNQRLQDLSDGREVEVGINDDMNYDCLDGRNARDMWSLLLHTGYLTATRVVSSDRCVVKIPNLEIKECFDKSIMASFEETVSKGGANLAVLDALSSGDDSKAQILLQGMLSSFVSIRAFASRREPENYYEGFLTGLLASLGRNLQDLKVESDAGNGYADIQFRYRSGSCAMVIELKASRSVGELSSGVQRALAQIEEKHYASRHVEDPTIFKVTAAGIAFLGKSCLVATKTLKDQQAAF
ncbi:MAG: AAA family ATPase, partial [Succinivibrio sp.]